MPVSELRFPRSRDRRSRMSCPRDGPSHAPVPRRTRTAPRKIRPSMMMPDPMPVPSVRWTKLSGRGSASEMNSPRAATLASLSTVTGSPTRSRTSCSSRTELRKVMFGDSSIRFSFLEMNPGTPIPTAFTPCGTARPADDLQDLREKIGKVPGDADFVLVQQLRSGRENPVFDEGAADVDSQHVHALIPLTANSGEANRSRLRRSTFSLKTVAVGWSVPTGRSISSAGSAE